MMTKHSISRPQHPLTSPSPSQSGVVASLVLPALILLTLATLIACRTTEGFGDDIEHLGGNIEDSAARNK